MKGKEEKTILEIYNSLFKINEQVCYHQEDKEITNSVCRELRKISNRVDKLKEMLNNKSKCTK